MESDQNHNEKFNRFLTDLTKGHKPNQRIANKELLEIYEERLQNKDQVKEEIILSTERSTNRPCQHHHNKSLFGENKGKGGRNKHHHNVCLDGYKPEMFLRKSL